MAFTAESVSILNGQDVVDVNSAESIENIKAGDFLQIGSFPLVEIKQAYKNGQGQKFIQLIKAWELTTQNNQPAIVIPTSGEFRAAVKALQDANILVNDNQQAMQDYQNKLGTVTFKKSDGTTTTVKTLKQIEADNQAQMNAYHPFPWAMRKVEFEAMRAANNEKYAASGFVHKGKEYAADLGNVINQGMYVNPASAVQERAKVLHLGRNEVSQTGESKTDYPFINIAGVVTKLLGADKGYSIGAWDRDSFIVKLPPAEDGTRTYDSATGVSVTHATPALAFAAETATNKVVTDRVDMWGVEPYLREITDNDPFVYKYGLIQSLATDINGVTTVSDNVRPITYFAWYEGDTTSRGKGVNWQTATEAQRIAIASDPKNNIYFDDETGNFYQWCVRGRSFAGIGNGDWLFIDSSKSNGLVFSITPLKIIPNQGISDIVPDATLNNYYVPAAHSYSMHTDVGAYRATRGSKKNVTNAVNGECYFLVCGTTLRLNKGAYHPSLNPFGSAKWRDSNLGNNIINSSSNWDGIIDPACVPTEKAQAFDLQPTGGVSTPCASNTSGFIDGPAGSGRPDLRFYDAIYASGQGGVCRDMRYSAWGLTAEDFAEADLKIKSGEYRGFEKLFFTKKVLKEVSTSDNALASGTQVSNTDNYTIGDLITVYSESGETLINEALILSKTETGIIWDGTKQFERVYGETYILVTGYYTNISVADEFIHTEVIGDPDEILLCDHLKEGWVGSWNSFIPDGSALWSSMILNRPTEVTSLTRVYTNDNGVIWNSTSIAIDPVATTPTVNDAPAIGRVEIWSYKTKARPTTPSTVSEIHGAISDVNYLFTSMDASDAKGRLLNYSLTGLIQTHAATATKIGLENIRLESLPLLPALGKFWGFNASAGELRHSPLSLDAPSNDSPAFKALNYNVAKNQQGFINYAYAQLTYDATAGDWGDDGKIHIADNQTTMPDENGHINLVGMAQCVEPIGWLKNDK